MLTPQQEELQIIESKINDATYALQRAANTKIDGVGESHCLYSIATSLIAIAKLMQLQAEQKYNS